MITDLDAPAGRDLVRVGGKAAALAAARAAGAAVLPGFVVTGEASRHHMGLGAKTLPDRGSGGARLAVSGEPIEFVDDLVAAGRQLGDRLVARSSTLLEASAEWSGAFTSYVDIGPSALPKAVVGCWASAFSVAALERQEAAGIEPGTFLMSVLVQPALEPEAGGWAKLGEDGVVTVYGTKGAPAPLLQGWTTGHQAHYDGAWSGDELLELVDEDGLDSIRSLLELVAVETGANRCEWAMTDRVWALQLGRASPPDEDEMLAAFDSPGLSELTDLARTVVLAPGPLGEELVLPWALAGIPDGAIHRVPDGLVNMDTARRMSLELTEEVWGIRGDDALEAARKVISRLGGGDIEGAIPELRRLSPPDPRTSWKLLSVLHAFRAELVERGVVPVADAAWHLDPSSVEAALAGRPVASPSRLGIGRWEPLVASVALVASTHQRGTPSSPGLGAGRRGHVDDPHRGVRASRGVVTALSPLPNLAGLLWDAAGLVTVSGSPAAHVFEAARALRVPAVCGVDLGGHRDEVVAVDGYSGVVATLALDLEL